MFDPTQHGFHPLDRTFQSVRFFARRPDANTREASLSFLTVYLSQDGDYVMIWFGLFDPGVAQFHFEEQLPALRAYDFDFASQYNTPLFDGYVKDAETGHAILDAVRLNRFGDQQLTLCDGAFQCDALPRP